MTVERVETSAEWRTNVARNLRRGRTWPRWLSSLYGRWLMWRLSRRARR